jgi:hypothetical protein
MHPLPLAIAALATASLLMGVPSSVAQTPGIQVAYKLDSRITGGSYLGVRWVAPAIFRTARLSGKSIKVQALAQLFGATGDNLRVVASWVPANSNVVSVAPSGTEVTLTVRCGPKTTMRVEAAAGARNVAVIPICSSRGIQAEFRQ